MSFGIPYARQYWVPIPGYMAAECPECGVMIRLRQRKDHESFTGKEYADHYEQEHANTEEEPMKLAEALDRVPPSAPTKAKAAPRKASRPAPKATPPVSEPPTAADLMVWNGTEFSL